jgi:hypothetical protein
MMEFNETYKPCPQAEDNYTAEEKRLRHVFHQAGHEWIAMQFRVGPITANLNFDGQSSTRIEGIRNIKESYQIGVAGMLAEAKGIYDCDYDNAPIDYERIRSMCSYIMDVFYNKSPSEEFAHTIYVPLSFQRFARSPLGQFESEHAQLSVSDLAEPIREGLNEEQLFKALLKVSDILNDGNNWVEFRDFAMDKLSDENNSPVHDHN